MKERKMSKPEFSKLRSIFWPIHGWELKKFLPMSIMMGLILFNYSVLRATKDGMFITASGAEAISFLKVWGVLPAAMLMMVFYSKMAGIMSKPKIFYSFTGFFVLFFVAFALFLYPNHQALHPSQEAVQAMQESFPRFRFLIAIYGSWTYALFYIMAEMWGSMFVSLLFWQFANDVTKVTESRRFYAMFGLISNFFVVFAGIMIEKLSDIRDTVPAGVDPWQVSLNNIVGAVVISAMLMVALYWFLQTHVLTDKRFFDATEIKVKKKKAKLSMTDGLKLVFTSPYIGLIAILVISYGMSINLIEATWKASLKELNPDPNAYTRVMGGVLKYMGMVTIFCMLVGANILRMFSWFTSAVITPAIMGITGTLFFAFIIFGEYFNSVTEFLAMTPILVISLLGTIQNVFSKSVKYALFDPTKEMAYIPLDSNLKTRGKAAVDVVGGRLGKSGGALIQQILFIVTAAGSQMEIAPYLAVITIGIFVMWIMAVSVLSGRFKTAVAEMEAAKAAEKTES
jgi:AAA family ATP:ADP antiporter